jgi:prepilin-type N-terminal cleavage/methylation domain-containing protein
MQAHKRIRNNFGFTMIELMVAIVLGLILMSAVYGTYTVQSRSYATQESSTEATSQGNTAFDMIADDIRNTGFGVPEDMAKSPVNSITNTIQFVNGGTTKPDAIKLVSGYTLVAKMATDVAVFRQRYLCITPVESGKSVSNLFNEYWYGGDKSNGSIDGVFPFIVTYVYNTGCPESASKGYIYLKDTLPSVGLTSGRSIYLTEDLAYCIYTDNTKNPPVKVLRRIRRNANLSTCTGVTSSTYKSSYVDAIADNVEDIQFAFTTAENDTFTSTLPASNFTIRAVRINVLIKTDKPDPNLLGMTLGEILNRPKSNFFIEDRTYDGALDIKGFRYRLFTGIINIRNLHKVN